MDSSKKGISMTLADTVKYWGNPMYLKNGKNKMNFNCESAKYKLKIVNNALNAVMVQGIP